MPNPPSFIALISHLFIPLPSLKQRDSPAFSMLDLDSSRVSMANELAETEEV
jgi:hypothetical protein